MKCIHSDCEGSELKSEARAEWKELLSACKNRNSLRESTKEFLMKSDTLSCLAIFEYRLHFLAELLKCGNLSLCVYLQVSTILIALTPNLALVGVGQCIWRKTSSLLSVSTAKEAHIFDSSFSQLLAPNVSVVLMVVCSSLRRTIGWVSWGSITE